ncbi:MAG: CHASE3 domain-containing protein [Verrucomicrobia bacterium]|nr:CHASE3 domain-containing protein [Verrucomicrobiota bacterium]
MKWNVGTKIGVGFGLVMVIFVIVGAVSYRSTTQLIEASDLRKRTHDVLTQLAEVLWLLTDVQTGQRGYVLTGEDAYLEPYQSALGKLDQTVSETRRLTSDNAHQQRRLQMLEPLIKTRLSLSREMIEVRRTNSLEAAVQIIKAGKGETNMDEIRKVIGEMEGEENDLLKNRVEAAQHDARNAKWTIVLGTLTAFVLAALAGFAITRNIARPLQNLTTVAERITVGDLSVQVSSDGRTDEVGVLARTFDRMTQSLRTMAGAAEQIAAGDLRSTIKPQAPNDVLGNAFARMVENLREQTRQLVEGANVLGSAASEIVASTTQLASSASESAAAVSETTTTVEEVRQTAQVASQKAKAVSDSAQKAAQISQSGRKSTEDASAGMNRIRQQMEAIAASMVRLSEQSQTIGQIIATVEDLAAQSNLLAVNAAIEAAKAGEHGKGFGVVAQEVKSLAEQSRQATNQVRTILSDIQKATTAAVMATEQGNKAVEAGEKQTGAAGESIQVLAGSVSEAAQAATQIASSSQQQLVGVDQVATAMESIKQASTQNVAGAKQLETAARNINELGRRLKQMVERYKV